jgi:hypothetical protein
MVRSKVGALMATAAVALAAGGCGGGGGSDNAAATSASTTAAATQAATTPQTTTTAPAPPVKSASGSWAKKLCTAMAKNQQPVNPPQINPADPQATITAMAKFLDDIGAQIQAQRDAIAQVGPPPGAKARRAYEKVQARLATVHAKVTAASKRLSSTKVSNAKDMNALFKSIGQDMQNFASYGGPVRDLIGRNGDLAKAISREPACRSLS